MLVPVLALGLYLHFGAADKVALTQEFAQAPKSMEEMTTRLERGYKPSQTRPKPYFLGRAYMAEQRPADAARTFERAVALAGRQPELLGSGRKPLYFVADKQWSPQLQALTDEALKADPNEVTSLAARYRRFRRRALPASHRLLAAFAGAVARAMHRVRHCGIDRAAERLGSRRRGRTNPRRRAPEGAVELAAALRDKVKPDDTVFIFARASNGPPMPLAAKRVTVAQLPIEVELSDADAMMPQMKLSDFAEVQLMARVSRAGQPTQGEWIGQGAPLSSATKATQHLTIDSPDP